MFHLKSTSHHLFPKHRKRTRSLLKGRKRTQKNVVYPGFPVLLRSFEVFSELLRSFANFAFFSFDLRQCVKYLSLISTGQMDYDYFFETKNDALSMVWQRVSKIICTSNVYYRYILFLEHNSVLYRIYGFLSTQNRAYSGLSTYQVASRGYVRYWNYRYTMKPGVSYPSMYTATTDFT